MNALNLSLIAIFFIVTFFFFRINNKKNWVFGGLGLTQLILVSMLVREWIALSFCLWFIWKSWADQIESQSRSFAGYFDETTVEQLAQGLVSFILLYLASVGAAREYQIFIFTTAFAFISQLDQNPNNRYRHAFSIFFLALMTAILQGGSFNGQIGGPTALLSFQPQWIQWLGQITSGLLFALILHRIRLIGFFGATIKLMKILTSVTMLMPRKTIMIVSIVCLLIGYYWVPLFYIGSWLCFSFLLHSYYFTNIALNIYQYPKVNQLSFATVLVGTFILVTYWKLAEIYQNQNLSWMIWVCIFCLFTYYLNLYWRSPRESHVPHIV